MMPSAVCDGNVQTQDPTLTCGARRNPLIRLAFRKIIHHQQGDYMISRNASQTKYLHRSSNVNIGSWVQM